MSRLDRTAIAIADRKLVADMLTNPLVQVMGWTLFMMAIRNKELVGSYNPFNVAQGGTLIDRVQAGTMWGVGAAAIAVAHVPDKAGLISSLSPGLKLG